jgi:Oxidoreductase family, NAD-binding Rossmann fold
MHAASISPGPQSALPSRKLAIIYPRSDVAKRWLRVSDTSKAASGFNRRKFLQGAVLTGTAALTAKRLLGQARPENSPTSTSTLIRPATPGTPEDPPLAPPDKQPPTLNVPTREQQVGWTIVGLGQLTLERILPAFGACKSSYPAALVSGHPEKARQLAGIHGVDPEAIYGYEDFERVRENPRIDVVYIVLPNSMHAEWTIRALQSGKHVLCEKPMAASLPECEAMINAARKAERILGVAYRLHYEPMNLAVMEMCRKKEFGKIKTFTASNCQNVKAPNIRLSGPLGEVRLVTSESTASMRPATPSEKSRSRRSLLKGRRKRTPAFEKFPNPSAFFCVIRPESWQHASAPSELLAARAIKCSASMAQFK